MIFLLVGQGTNGSSGSTDEVPKVIGMNYDDAVLNYPNIEFEVAEQEYTDKYEENIIYKQNVEAGQFVKEEQGRQDRNWQSLSARASRRCRSRI